MRYIHTILHRALKDAVRWGRIVRNPSDFADPPRASAATPPPMVTWPSEVLREFLTLSRTTEDRYVALWTLLATTGMRRGEALGLRWQDFDLQRRTASVVQTVVVVNHVEQLSTPKTARGTRVVDLDDGTITALRAHRAHQHQERLLMGEGWRERDLIFCKVDGEALHPERVSREFLSRIERWSLPPLTLHGLRHTWATLALKAGINAKVVQERLGHATIGITLGTYSHVTEGMQREAANTVAAVIFGP